MSDRLLTIADVCEKLRISRRCAYRWIVDGKIPPAAVVRLGSRTLRVREPALEEWLRSGAA